MNKAPAFLFYAGDFLSSPDVQSMDTREVGAYVLLLLNAWQGDLPGHLLNNEDRLRRLTRMSAAEWEVSRELLLSKFPIADMGYTRYNPRMIAEAQKQAENRAKKSEAGKRGGRPTNKQNESKEKQMLSESKHMLSESKANGKQTESLSISISPSTKVDDVAPSPEALKAETIKRRAALTTDPEDEQHWSTGPLTKPSPFKVIAERLGFLEIDFEHYRKQALVAAEDANTSRTINQWTSWIRNFFNNQQKHGPLLKVSSIDLSKPTPRNQYPAVGKEFAGQVFVLENTGDDVMNRHKIAATLKYYPTAAIHFTQIR